jgi:hypothetical protein
MSPTEIITPFLSVGGILINITLEHVISNSMPLYRNRKGAATNAGEIG